MVLKRTALYKTFSLLIGSVLGGAGSFQVEAIVLDDLLEKAYKQNLDYQIAMERLQQAQNNQTTAFGALFPDLNLVGNRGQELDNNQGPNSDTSYSARLQVSQTLYDPEVWTAWKVSELRTLDAELAFLRVKQQLTFNVKQAWFQLVTDNAIATEAKASLERLQQHRANAQHLYANGSIWRNDLLQADVQVARGEQSLLLAQNTATRTLTNLNILLNQNILVAIEPEHDLSDVSFDMELGKSLQIAIEKRPDLQQFNLAISIARQNKRAASSDFWPTFSAQLTQSNLADNFELSDASRDTQLSITMNWTLWDNWSIRNRNRNAIHDIEIARKSYELTRQQVQQEAHSAWLSLQEAKQNVRVLEQAVRQAEENYRVTEIRYKEQLSTANDVLIAQQLLTDTRNDLFSARGAFYIARAQLALAMGT